MKGNRLSVKIFSIYMISVFVNMVFFMMSGKEEELFQKNLIYWAFRLITEGTVIIYMIKNWKKDDYLEEKKKIGIRKFLKYFFITVFLGLIVIPLKIFPYIFLKNDIMMRRGLFVFQYPDVGTIFNMNFNLLRSIVYFPVFEELFYRAFMRKDIGRYGYRVSLIVTTVFFAISHSINAAIIEVALVGVLYFYIASEYSVKYSIMLHMLYNAYVLMQRKISSMGEGILSDSLLILFLLINAFSIIAGIYFSIRGGVGKYFLLISFNDEDRGNFRLFIKENKGSLVIISLLFIIGILF